MTSYRKENSYGTGDVVWCEIKGYPVLIISEPNENANYKTLDFGKDEISISKNIFYVDRSWKVGSIKGMNLKNLNKIDDGEYGISLDEYANQMDSVVESESGEGYRYKTHEVSKGGQTDN